MELEERLYSVAEIAEWFGIKPDSIYSLKAQKMKELKEYCDFIDHGKAGIEITKVYNAVYVKPALKKVAEKVFNKFWLKYGKFVDSQERIAKELQKKEPDYDFNTLLAAVRQHRKKHYGSPNLTWGKSGVSKFNFVKVNENGYYENFSPEEEQKKNEVAKDFLVHNGHIQMYQRLMAAKQSRDNKEITNDEYNEIFQGVLESFEKDWNDFQFQFEKELGQKCAFVIEVKNKNKK